MMDQSLALQIHAGPRAREHLRQHGLRAQDIRVIAGAAGGPKGLTLLPLDQFIFGQWLSSSTHTVHLVGASIGAWRMAMACTDDPVQGFHILGQDYIHERYGAEDGRLPTPEQASRIFAQRLDIHFEAQFQQILRHPRWRLHVLTSHGRGLLSGDAARSRWRTGLGYAAAVGMNLFSRRAMAPLLERVLFSSAGEPLPLALNDIRTQSAVLDEHNLRPAILASCSIPFWLQAVHDIPGAPRGAYWDGGITDYHVHLNYGSMTEGLALVPHFQPYLVPGWLDKPLKRRHLATDFLDNAVVLCPSREWVASLPGGKLPDRQDFKTFARNPEERERRWLESLRRSAELSACFEQMVARPTIEALPLP